MSICIFCFFFSFFVAYSNNPTRECLPLNVVGLNLIFFFSLFYFVEFSVTNSGFWVDGWIIVVYAFDVPMYAFISISLLVVVWIFFYLMFFVANYDLDRACVVWLVCLFIFGLVREPQIGNISPFRFCFFFDLVRINKGKKRTKR